ncbi:MAG TPA: hypothetical protein VGS19_22430 [Streptosporangiaceae bacterium]|nr:hypothetical protein [Streptosporangiaceae bacterium]
MGKRWLVPAGLAGVMLALAACGTSSGSGGSSSTTPASNSAAGTTIKTGKVGGATVLTNGSGLTVYWFGPDTSTKSNCNGSCATYWPPVPGPATAGPGVSAAKLGTITRSGGKTQATYNGHPLYTYVQDSAPGQANGNGKNLSGGVWHDITMSGSSSAAPSQSTSGGGGYGY